MYLLQIRRPFHIYVSIPLKHKTNVASGILVSKHIYVTVNLCNQGIREFPECF